MFHLNWTLLLPVAKSYVEMLATSGYGNAINVLIYFMAGALGVRIIYVGFGGRNSAPSNRAFKGANSPTYYANNRRR